MSRSLTVQGQRLPFLEGLDADLRVALLTSLRVLWTHTSTALEGNTFTLEDTAFFLQEGLTIGGKSLREHEEVYGHARAIECVYDLVQRGNKITVEDIFRLHTLVQRQAGTDVCAPVGAWKVEPNGTYAIGADGKSFFLEYPAPALIPALMHRWLEFFASCLTPLTHESSASLTRENAAHVFAAVHTSFVRIHPFADGNGRMARLLANIPLLASGLPPLLIAAESRCEYIGLLGAYEQEAGPLTAAPALDVLLPENDTLKRSRAFCAREWQSTWDEIDKVRAVQGKRGAR